jgi:hypothetical protein
MKIFIICSKSFYDRIPEIKKTLESNGHIITLPNCFDDPMTEARYRELGFEEHAKWKSSMIKHSEEVIKKQDAVLVLNFEKHGISNYIGGATFLEMYDAFKLNKKIYLFNNIPEGILKDEISGFHPMLINSDLSQIS